MSTQVEHAILLNKLHIKGNPLILYNVWDAGSARALQTAGAKVIATGSWSVAASQGYDDGEKLSLDFALANLKRIIASVDLPVTVDIEGGYAQTPAGVKETITKVIEVGAVGINIEDQIVGDSQLYSIEEQQLRIKAVREASEDAGIPIFINARTDIFLKADPATHVDVHVDQAIDRAYAYAESGATGFFVPGIWTKKHIEKICKQSPIPVNIMVTDLTPSSKQLAELGVARISYGSGPYLHMMDVLKEAGRKALVLS